MNSNLNLEFLFRSVWHYTIHFNIPFITIVVYLRRCADKYFVWVWKDGQQKGQGKKYVIPNKNTLTKIVDIEPCLFHNFRLCAC